MGIFIVLGAIVTASILCTVSLVRNEFQSVKSIEKRHAYSIGYATGRGGKRNSDWDAIYGDTDSHERKAYERGYKAGARSSVKV